MSGPLAAHPTTDSNTDCKSLSKACGDSEAAPERLVTRDLWSERAVDCLVADGQALLMNDLPRNQVGKLHQRRQAACGRLRRNTGHGLSPPQRCRVFARSRNCPRHVFQNTKYGFFKVFADLVPLHGHAKSEQSHLRAGVQYHLQVFLRGGGDPLAVCRCPWGGLFFGDRLASGPPQVRRISKVATQCQLWLENSCGPPEPSAHRLSRLMSCSPPVFPAGRSFLDAFPETRAR